MCKKELQKKFQEVLIEHLKLYNCYPELQSVSKNFANSRAHIVSRIPSVLLSTGEYVGWIENITDWICDLKQKIEEYQNQKMIKENKKNEQEETLLKALEIVQMQKEFEKKHGYSPPSYEEVISLINNDDLQNQSSTNLPKPSAPSM